MNFSLQATLEDPSDTQSFEHLSYALFNIHSRIQIVLSVFNHHYDVFWRTQVHFTFQIAGGNLF